MQTNDQSNNLLYVCKLVLSLRYYFFKCCRVSQNGSVFTLDELFSLYLCVYVSMYLGFTLYFTIIHCYCCFSWEVLSRQFLINPIFLKHLLIQNLTAILTLSLHLCFKSFPYILTVTIIENSFWVIVFEVCSFLNRAPFLCFQCYIYVETSQLIYRANQLRGVCMRKILFINIPQFPDEINCCNCFKKVITISSTANLR